MSKPRQRVLAWLATTVALSFAVYYATIRCYPSLYMSACLRKLAAISGTNQFFHGSQPTAADRDKPCLPSPDLTYSAATYDLSKGPLRVRAPVVGSYTSVSLYAANADNFYVANDRQCQKGRFDFILAGPNMAVSDKQELPVIRSPSMTGGILVRFFVTNRDALSKIDLERRRLSCTLLTP